MTDGFDDWRFAIVDGKVPAQDDLKALRDGTVRAAVLRKLTDTVNGKPNMKPLTNSTSKLKLISISAPNNSYLAVVFPEGTRLNVFGVIRQPERSILDSAYVKRIEAKVDRWLEADRPVATEVQRRQAKSVNKPPTKTSRGTRSEKKPWLTPEMVRATPGLDLEKMNVTTLAREETGLRFYVSARQAELPYDLPPQSPLEAQARRKADVDRSRKLDNTVRVEARIEAIHKAIEMRCLEASPLQNSEATTFEHIQAGWTRLTNRDLAKTDAAGLDYMI